MEVVKAKFTKRLGIAATVVSLTGGSIALWNQLKPEEELPDLSGQWTITDTVTAARDTDYIGDTHEYVIPVLQDNEKLKGEGKQTKYNQRYASRKWPILIEGVCRNDVIKVTHKVNPDSGGFTGSMTLRVDPTDPRRLVRTFTTTIAGQAGEVVVRVE